MRSRRSKHVLNWRKYARHLPVLRDLFRRSNKAKKGHKPAAPENYRISIRKFPVFGSESSVRDLMAYCDQYRNYEFPPRRFFSVREGLAVGPHFLLLKDDRIVPASYRGQRSISRTPIMHRYAPNRFQLSEAATIRQFAEPVMVVGGKASAAFYHWVVEIVPRLLMVKARFGTSIPILLRPLRHLYQKESLATLGLRYIEVTEDAVAAPEIWFPSHMVLWIGKGCMSPDLVSLSHSFASLVPQDEPRAERFYISRGDALTRRVQNERDVITALQPYGFRPLRLSEHPFAEQVALFRSAEAIIGPHGGGFASLVYCRPGTKVVELYAEGSMAVSPFCNISSLAGLDYAMCLCPAQVQGRESLHNGDMTVDIDRLQGALRDQGL
jgi:capsular polysaccharide biosynthesis protein